MKDKLNNELKINDFVQIIVDKNTNKNSNHLKKGSVYKIHSFRIIDKLEVCYLTGKNGGYYCYNKGFLSNDIIKVNYDMKKRKIINQEEIL